MTTVVLARVIGANKVRRLLIQTAPNQSSRPIKAKQDSTARVLPCVNCAWAQSVVGYSLLQGGADG